jgi:A/G-specific adenine glycosylase
MSSRPDPLAFRQPLLFWYDNNARDLPWRRSHDPYAIWVSEIMLQQTRVAAVLEHYGRFMQRFPTLSHLASSTEDEVLTHWSGLGYYRRARLLLKAAQFIVAQPAKELPQTAVALRMLPGIGEYTAAAIASIGFGQAVACVDGNVERVLCRVNGWAEQSGLDARVRAEATRLLDPARPGDFNQAVMELGATVCLPRKPKCAECPVHEFCLTRGEHPVTERRKMRSQDLSYALFRRTAKAQKTKIPSTEVLLERRAANASLMPGMWELPELIAGSTAAGKKSLTLRHSITDTNYYVSIYELEAAEKKKLPRRKGVRQWFPVDELHTLPLTGLASKALKRLQAWPGYDGHGPVVRIDNGRQRTWFQG